MKQPRESLREAFAALHNPRAHSKVQISEHVFQDRRIDTATSRFWSSYRQLWLFTFRHFPAMTAVQARKNRISGRKATPTLEHRWWYELTSRYYDVREAEKKEIQDMLQRIRPSKYYQHDPERERQIVERIIHVIGDAAPAEQTQIHPELVSDTTSCGEKF
jgi:hypothetical protein